MSRIVTSDANPVFPNGATGAGEPFDVVVFNTGSTTVYLGDSSVTPATGVPLRAGSNVVWGQGKPLYACTDPGNTGALTYQEGAGSMFDAGGVANQLLAQGLPSQIASQINAQGVPQVFLNDLLALDAYGAELGVNQEVDIDVHRYASLNVQLNSAGGALTRAQLDFFQGPNQTGPASTLWLSNADTAMNAIWQIPLNAASLRLINRGTVPLPLSVYGSNRTIPRLVQLGANVLPRLFTFTGNLVAGTAVNLVAQDGGGASSVFNGPVILAWNTNLAGAGGVGRIGFADQSDTLSTAVTGAPITGNMQQTFNHPSVPCLWSLYPNVTQAAVINLAVIPAQSG